MWIVVMDSSIVKYIAKAILVKFCQTRNVLASNQNMYEDVKKNSVKTILKIAKKII
jgi:hypothetical protein